MNKKLILCFSLFFTVTSYAQDGGKYHNAIGLSLGLPTGLNYKTFLTEKSALDFVGGVRAGSDFSDLWATGLFEMHIDLKADGAKFYYGAGASLLYSNLITNHIGMGANLGVGLEYKFPEAPFVFAADWSPIFWLYGHHKEFDGMSGAIKVRYVLN